MRLLATMLLAAAAACAQSTTISDEVRVPPYSIPNVLTMANGNPVKSAEEWKLRRAELLRMFETEMYGKVPPKPAGLNFELMEKGDDALGGKAIRKQVRVKFARTAESPFLDLLLYLPKNAKGKVPVFLGLSFHGNQGVNADPAIRISESWSAKKDDPKTRGVGAAQWPVERIIERGYGIAIFYYCDVDPDFDDGFKNGVHALYGVPKADEWGSIGAWAWGAMRALDYLETDPQVDAKRVALMGHSRLGKAALYAGAVDERFALVISNDSGAGGAALSKRIFGETVGDLNKRFPHWFDANFKKYSGNEASLPFDQHELLALIAPRPLYVASAEQDLWADPRGEFLSAKAADPVYRLLTGDGLPATDMPQIDKAVMGRIGYHIRTGGHDVKLFDWERYMDFADRHLKK
jgi:hypothetical protein